MTNKTPNKTKTPVGGLILGSDPIEFNAGRKTITLKVRNTGDRPIQVGSHFHFFEVNRALEFDRHAAYGMRLNISSTTAIRFEPGDEKTVSLVSIGGTSGTYGFNNLVDGWTGDEHEPSSARPLGTKSGLGTRICLSKSKRTCATTATSPCTAAVKPCAAAWAAMPA